MEKGGVLQSSTIYCVRSIQFFYSGRVSTLKKYPNLFPKLERGSEEEDDTRTGPSIGEHYGWFLILHKLAKDGGILKLTDVDNITKVNFIYMLNWLSLEWEIAKEEDKKNKELINNIRKR